MNLRAGLELIRRTLFGWMAGRGFFWTLAFGWMVPSLVYLFVWITLAEQRAIGGFERHEFIQYYLVLIIVNQLTYPVSNWTVGDVIRSGGFATWLLRPMAPIYEAIAGDIAMKMVCMPFVLGLTVIIALVLQPAWSFTLESILLFLPTLLLTQALRFLMAYTLALLALWAQRSDALLALNDSLIFLFAGQVAPIALLPGALHTLAVVLPYRYALSFPVEVLVGNLSRGEVWTGLAIQLAWLAIIGGLYRFVWNKGLKHYVAVGG